MARYPNVNYWQYFDVNDNPNKISTICFSDLSGDEIRIRFNCLIDKSLNRFHVNFYTKFLSQILDKSLFTYEIVKDDRVTHVMFDLNCENLNCAQTLLYLTAFRIPQEFPEVISELYKHKNEPIKKLFDSFIDIHLLVCEGKLDLKYNDSFYGHSLIAPYDVSKYNKISFKQFKSNLKLSKESVNEYFGSDGN